MEEKRDLKDYTEKYLQDNFEDIQLQFRRKKVIEQISKYKHNSILEIGCGMEPLFKYLDGNEYSEYVVVEPSDIFYQNAERQANEKITILNAEFGTNKIDLSKYHFDFVLCSSLLHEIPNDFQFLKSIYAVCQENTVVHINVPNAKSFHRILAKNAGLIRDEHDLTEKNIMYQQSRVYDIEALKSLAYDCGFIVQDCGGYFVKPFTHHQMYEMLKNRIIDERILEGLYNISNTYEDMCSEIYVNMRISNKTSEEN